MAAGTRYAYRVRAINAQGPGPESPDAYAETPEPAPDPEREQQTVRATVSICDRTQAVEVGHPGDLSSHQPTTTARRWMTPSWRRSRLLNLSEQGHYGPGVGGFRTG